MVVLDELHVELCGVGESLGIEAFVKEPTVIAKHLWLDDEDFRQFAL
jgi:hypothetical protein